MRGDDEKEVRKNICSIIRKERRVEEDPVQGVTIDGREEEVRREEVSAD